MRLARNVYSSLTMAHQKSLCTVVAYPDRMSLNLDTETLEQDVQRRDCCTVEIHRPARESCNLTKVESHTAMGHRRWPVDVPDGLSHKNSLLLFTSSILNVKM